MTHASESKKKRTFPEPLLGSYRAADCRFLLKTVPADFQSVANKEYLIQSGQAHYSEMIHREAAPSALYTELFKEMTQRYKRRLAAEIMTLAKKIASARDSKNPICLLSLARAGTPIGVLLQRTLQQHLKINSVHYSISIIRDKGLDYVALDYLLEQEKITDQSLVFIDGWTAKGVITRELKQSIEQYNRSRDCHIAPELFVISDIGGSADVAATFDDYTMPNALMNSTVSGLISRSILNQHVGKDDFHGCVRYSHLHAVDCSNWFIDTVMAEVDPSHCAAELPTSQAQRQTTVSHFLNDLQREFQISDINRIKPGISEATRVMLRRVPDLLLLKEPNSADVAHLRQLAEEKKIPILERPTMPLNACALIKDVLKANV
ncbi:MAG: cysteine protease StiP family protein [Gammaproteobacteria bacterium]|nr:cysteine protease StiP family protein [Gammaproteobacteria bacterium]